MSGFSLESIAIIDWAGMALVLVGLVLGLRRGLGSAFALFLWLVASMWLASSLAPVVLGWMPNTANANDPEALYITYGSLVACVLMLPVLARILGGSMGRKKGDLVVHNRYMGALLGTVNAVLVVTLITPYSIRIQPVADTWETARTPVAAATVADNVPFLYSEAFRGELHDVADHGAQGPSPLDAAVDNAVEVIEELTEDAGQALEEAVESAQTPPEPAEGEGG